jgi:hypothetical protein
MSGKRSGPGALAGAAEAGIECSEQQFDTRSHSPQQSPSPPCRCAISRAVRRLERQLDRGKAGSLLSSVQAQGGHWIVSRADRFTGELLAPIEAEHGSLAGDR